MFESGRPGRTRLIVFALVGMLSIVRCEGQVEPDTSARDRTVAITIDDLPASINGDLVSRRLITQKLLATLTTFGVPAIGFVNERKLGEPASEPDHVALLQMWIDAGMELGNHTYSHPSLYSTPLEEFKQDVLRGEVVTSRLLLTRGDRIRFFRHPFLNTGPDLETKEAFEIFLAEHEYRVAPVTIDNGEWIYAAAYERAYKTGDHRKMSEIGSDYLRYMDSMFDYYETFSLELLGREPAQILLIHANRLNADYLFELAEMIVGKSYRFVSLDEALEDPAYSMTDTYTGTAGISWLHRWAITKGIPIKSEPVPPDWIESAAFPSGR